MRGSLCTGLAVALLLSAAVARYAHAGSACPTVPDPAALADATELREMNAFVDRLGLRATGSKSHARFVNWIRRRLKKISGVTLTEQTFPINRWTGGRTKLSMIVGGRTVRLQVAGPIPYAKATPGAGVSGPLALVPTGQVINAANAAGRIVVRPAPAGSIQNAAFSLPGIGWSTYDPGNTIDPNGIFYGDFLNYNARVIDIRNATAAGALGLLFVKELPREQLVDHYEPYEGTQWEIPGAYVGADEGKQLTDAIAAGGTPTARIAVRAKVQRVTTPSLFATIAGQSPQRIVIDSHTDGTNAVEDNGPVAMLTMARYFAALPMECRPRTLQFTFTTAHFYQRVADPAVRDGGAEQLAEQLDADYDQGTVSAVVVLEHLGAIDYQQVPRPDGVGTRLEPTGLPCIQFVAVTPSAPLVSLVEDIVQRWDMRRTILLQGSDLAGQTAPRHCSFGGQGTPYNQHILPTVGVISAPQSLYNPAFGLEGIDFELMYRQVQGFTELVNRMGTMSQADVAGEIPAERARRAAGAPACPEAN